MTTFCVLEQGSGINETLTLQKKEMFSTAFSDFYRLNWKRCNDPNAFVTAKNIMWSEGRSLLYANVPKRYDYYIFTDDDTQFYAAEGVDIAAKIRDLLQEYRPIAGTFFNPTSWLSKQTEGWYPEGLTTNDCLSKIAFARAHYDMEVQIYSRSFADVMFPIIYHGTNAATWYAQWVCLKLFPLKQMCFTEIQIANTVNIPHETESKMPNHFDIFELMYLFDRDVKVKPSFSYYKQQAFQSTLDLFNQAVNKEEIEFSIDHLATIYDTSNCGFKTRVPKSSPDYRKNLRTLRFSAGMIWYTIKNSETRHDVREKLKRLFFKYRGVVKAKIKRSILRR